MVVYLFRTEILNLGHKRMAWKKFLNIVKLMDIRHFFSHVLFFLLKRTRILQFSLSQETNQYQSRLKNVFLA